MPLCRAVSRLLLTHLIEMLYGLHAQDVPHKHLTLDAFLSSLIQCSLVQRELMVLVSLKQQGQNLTGASPMVPTRGTRARDETAAGSLTSSRSSVLSRPRRSAVEKSFSSSNCGEVGPSLGEGAHDEASFFQVLCRSDHASASHVYIEMPLG